MSDENKINALESAPASSDEVPQIIIDTCKQQFPTLFAGGDAAEREMRQLLSFMKRGMERGMRLKLGEDVLTGLTTFMEEDVRYFENAPMDAETTKTITADPRGFLVNFLRGSYLQVLQATALIAAGVKLPTTVPADCDCPVHAAEPKTDTSDPTN